MQNYVITCCSTVDMSPDFFKKRAIPFVSFHFNIEGKEYADDLGKSMSLEVFYQKLTDGATSTTSQVNIQEFIDFFEPILKAGKDILHVTLSSGLSGTYNSANIARNELLEKYPDRRIEIVDSLAASSGSGMLVETLADLRDQGATFNAVHEWAEENKLFIHHWFFSTDLTSYIKGGRITKTAGFFGKMLGICPLLHVNETGHLIPKEKVRLKRRVINKIVDKMKLHAKDGTNYDGKCLISHSACLDDAQEVVTLIERNFPNLKGKVTINNIGTVIGSHTGPGTVALFFMGDKR